jgi:hypothetical protein
LVALVGAAKFSLSCCVGFRLICSFPALAFGGMSRSGITEDDRLRRPDFRQEG